MIKFTKVIILIVTSLLILAGCNEEEPFEKVDSDETMEQEEQIDENAQTEEEAIELALSFIEELSNGEYEKASDKFDDTMQDQFGAEDLEELWESLEEHLGSFLDYEYSRTESVDGSEVILVDGTFRDVEAMFQVTVNENQEIAGFYIH